MNYILKDGVPVPEPDLMTFATWFETANRTLEQTTVSDEPPIVVSTVFLGIDHSFGEGPPVLWETMVFGGSLDCAQQRATTAEDARLVHAAMVAQVREAEGCDAP